MFVNKSKSEYPRDLITENVWKVRNDIEQRYISRVAQMLCALTSHKINDSTRIVQEHTLALTSWEGDKILQFLH
jgi:hypothetical protein